MDCLFNLTVLSASFDRYGHHLNNNSYFICHDKEKIKHIFTRIRTMSGAPDTVCLVSSNS